MTKKPSERLLEIYNVKRKQEDVGHAVLLTLMDYFDESTEQTTVQDGVQDDNKQTTEQDPSLYYDKIDRSTRFVLDDSIEARTVVNNDSGECVINVPSVFSSDTEGWEKKISQLIQDYVDAKYLYSEENHPKIEMLEAYEKLMDGISTTLAEARREERQKVLNILNDMRGAIQGTYADAVVDMIRILSTTEK